MKLRKILASLCVLALLAVPASPQSAPRATYIATVGAQATTGAILLSIESSATQGFRLLGWCVSSSSATAAAAVNVTVRRTTTASASGTQLTAEGTGSTAVSKMYPGHANFPGIARLGGTPGTDGATLDQVGFTVGEIAAGTADPHGPEPICKTYLNTAGIPVPEVVAGTANGISINVSSAGSGGLASGSITAIVELLQP